MAKSEPDRLGTDAVRSAALSGTGRQWDGVEGGFGLSGGASTDSGVGHLGFFCWCGVRGGRISGMMYLKGIFNAIEEYKRRALGSVGYRAFLDIENIYMNDEYHDFVVFLLCMCNPFFPFFVCYFFCFFKNIDFFFYFLFFFSKGIFKLGIGMIFKEEMTFGGVGIEN